MAETTGIFSGNAAIAYAAFNLRDPYYREMVNAVIHGAQYATGRKNLGIVVDLGAGIGISTMEILKHADRVVAVEPDAGMRYMLELNVMGNPAVNVVEGRGESLVSALYRVDQLWTSSVLTHIFLGVGAVLCSQVFHLFNPPGKETLVPKVLYQCMDSLKRGGVLAFDLSPSNYEFSLPLADHRNGEVRQGEIMTELAHPLYQRVHQVLLKLVKEKFPDFQRENLWPPVSARMSYAFLRDNCEVHRLGNFTVLEELVPISGERIIDFPRNGWTVFFRWPPLSELPAEEKLALMNTALSAVFLDPDFEAMKNVMAYHPTAVCTAVKYRV